MADGGEEPPENYEKANDASSTAENNNNNTTDDTREEYEEKESQKNKINGTKSNQGDTSTSAIDLNVLEKKYDIKNKSTLPLVLAEYVSDDEEIKDKKKKKKKKKMPPPSKRMERDSSFMSEGENEREKQKREHYLTVYSEVHTLRDYYYGEYMDLLRDKVQQQRQEIKAKSDAMDSKIRKREMKERMNSHKFKKRLDRIDLKDNSSFLKDIPKSDYYKITKLVDKMKSEGKLKTNSDVDHFWEDIRKPEVYKKYFGSTSDAGSQGSTVARSRTVSDSSHQSYVLKPAITKPARELPPTTQPVLLMDFRPMMGIDEAKESSRPTTKHSTRHNDPTYIAKQAAVALDKKCPQLDLPPLSCFSMELGEKPPDPIEVQREIEMDLRDRERRRFVKNLRKMYQLSLAHSTTTQRILDTHGDDFALALGETDVIDFTTRRDWAPVTITRDPEPEAPWARYTLPSAALPTSGTHSRYSSAASSGKVSDSAIQRSTSAKSGRSQRSPPKPEEITPIESLTLDNVKAHGKVMEAKCLSTFWNNYAKSGRSVFANT